VGVGVLSLLGHADYSKGNESAPKGAPANIWLSQTRAPSGAKEFGCKTVTRTLIEIREGTGGKSAFVGKTRVRVSDIARLYNLWRAELVAERIQKSLPHLTAAQIHAAIEYWRTHPKEIESEIEEEEALLSSIPSKH